MAIKTTVKCRITGILKVQYKALLKDGHFQSVSSLPLWYFGEIERSLTEKVFFNDIAALEYLFHAAYDNVLIKTFPQDYCLNLTEKAHLNGYDLEVKSCREFVALKDIAGILTTIKARLINFIQPVSNAHPDVMVA